MKKILLSIIIGVFCLGALTGEPPGASTFGKPTRQNGRIVYEPYNTNPVPTYYQGNLIYQSQGAAYRDSRGRIRYQTNSSQYPYRSKSVDYGLERQRIRERDRYIDEQTQNQNNRGNYPRDVRSAQMNQRGY